MNKTIGYYEFELPDNTVIPMKFGMTGLERLCKLLEVKLPEIQIELSKRLDEEPITTMGFIALAGANNYSLIKGTGRDKYNYEQALEWVEAGGVSNSVTDMVTELINSILPPTDADELNDEEEEDEIDKVNNRGKKKKK